MHATTALGGASATVSITVDPNPTTSARSATVRVGDQNFTVNQIGGLCGFSLNAYSALFGPAGGPGTSLGSASAVGCTPDYGADQPFIGVNPPTGPVANIFSLPYTVQPFILLSPAVRTGNVTFGGQILKVKQTSY